MITVVIPVKNEADNIAPLLGELGALSESIPLDEIMYVDDGSTDQTHQILNSLRDKYPTLRIVTHDHTAGQSAALWTGIQAASNELVATIDGDGQNDPADIAKLYEYYEAHADAEGPLMVMGQRMKRRDTFIRRLSSRIANGVRSSMLHDATRDTGCSLKLFRRSDYLALPYFDHMHRFLPALMNRQGIKVQHIDVVHRPRIRGTSKYGMWDRLWVGISDLFGVMWLQRRSRPTLKVIED